MGGSNASKKTKDNPQIHLHCRSQVVGNQRNTSLRCCTIVVAQGKDGELGDWDVQTAEAAEAVLGQNGLRRTDTEYLNSDMQFMSRRLA